MKVSQRNAIRLEQTRFRAKFLSRANDFTPIY